MRRISLTACIAAIMCSCNQNAHPELMNGLWKIRKVEILKDHELKIVIDTAYQLWSFKRPSIIEIIDKGRTKNILHIKMDSSSIRSYDKNGKLKEEFMIRSINNGNVTLASKQKVEDEEYHIIYYLDRVKDGPPEGPEDSN